MRNLRQDPNHANDALAGRALDSYLSLAESVLKGARRPLSPREILSRAYLDKAVPKHLFGKTQYKTLGARLSEDILIRRERSAFFRTNPGQFFLRQFLADTSIPEKFRTPIVARRRERELQRGALLSVAVSDLIRAIGNQASFAVGTILKLLRLNRFHYVDARQPRDEADAVVWSFVVVSRKRKVLSYRIGRYRDGRDTFLTKRSIGFFRPVCERDRTLFDLADHGIVSSGVRAASIDLDFPQNVMSDQECRERSQLTCFLFHKTEAQAADLLALIKFDCPDWFEPTKRRLAINDLQWLDLDTPLNYIEDFDPWSRLALAQMVEQGFESRKRGHS
jgi:hypothetical protein